MQYCSTVDNRICYPSCLCTSGLTSRRSSETSRRAGWCKRRSRAQTSFARSTLRPPDRIAASRGDHGAVPLATTPTETLSLTTFVVLGRDPWEPLRTAIPVALSLWVGTQWCRRRSTRRRAMHRQFASAADVGARTVSSSDNQTKWRLLARVVAE